MHEAYSTQPPGKINSQIECVAGYDNFVFLGNRVGHLSQYSVQPRDDGDGQKVLQLLQYDKNFSKKNIVQIEVVPECRVLFCLSGEKQLNIHDISEHSFPLVHTEPKTRGATLFALTMVQEKSSTGEAAIIIRLCVAVKRKLQLYFFKKDFLEEFAKDIDLSDVPKTMCWMNDTICLGFDSEYILYKLDKEVPVKISLFPPSSAKSIFPYISTVEGEVFALAKDEFTILVDPNAKVTATEKENVMGTGMSPRHQPHKSSGAAGGGADKQNPLSKYNNRSIRWSQPLKAFLWDYPYAVGLLADSIEIRTVDNATEPIQVIRDLPGVRYSVRTSSGMLFAASVSQLWQIKMTDIPTQIQQLNEKNNFQLSLDLIKISHETEEAKQEETRRVKTLLGHYLFESKRFEEAMDVFIDLNMDPCFVIKLFPNFQSKDKAVTLVLDDHEVEKALMALQYFLAAVRPNVKKDFDLGNTQPVFFDKTPAAMLSIIDTTMLKCYLQTKDSLVAPLLRLNHCHLEESEKLLKKYQKHRELIILYQTKRQHRMALDLLKSMDDSPSGTNGLNGLTETIRYLQSLGSEHTPLICEYSNWVLAKDPEEGLKIFTVDMEAVENLPRGVILDFLLKNHKAVVIPYLTHIIEVWAETKQLFHNILVQMYRDKIWEVEVKLGKGAEEALELRKKLFKFLKESQRYSPEAVLNDFPKNDFFEERTIILSRSGQHKKALQIFVQVLGDYERALSYCAKNYREPNHLVTSPVTLEGEDNSQDVYFNLIEILLSNPKESPFMDVALHENCLDRALVNEQVFAVLDQHGAKINAQKVIEIMPDEVPLARLSTFLETALHHQLEQRRKTQILKGLLHADQLLIHEERIRSESKCVLITDSTLCHICKRKFNNGSAFVRYPTGDVVHFSCQQRYKL